MSKLQILSYSVLGLALFYSAFLPALAQTFPDVLPSNPNFTAIEYLKGEGIIKGYPDGTFKPDQIVNRAEALKIIFTARETVIKDFLTSSFRDVAPSDWFFTFIETAKDLQIVGGYPDGTFSPGRLVNKAEFLKMTELGYGVKFVNYELPIRPLYTDMTDQSAWYVQYFDFAKNLNLIIPDSQNKIFPSANLSRGEVAGIIYRFELIIQGGATQMMLSRTEAQLLQLLYDLKANDLTNSLIDISNAKSIVQQALDKSPNEKIVQAAFKLVEAFDHLTSAYSDVAKKDLTSALSHCTSAYSSADQSLLIDTSVENLANQVKSTANALAEVIRSKQ